MRFIKWLFGLAFVGGTLAIAVMAIGAALGFSHSALDFFNHLQPLLFVSALLSLFAAPILLRTPRWRSLTVAIAATGFLASAIIVVPEAVSAFTQSYPAQISGRPTYKLLTHNLFGLNYDATRIAEAIANENPDIITLQEYFPEQRSGLHIILARDYPYFSICQGGKRANIAIYAKYPFNASREGTCSPGGTQRISRIVASFSDVDGVPFTIITTHLDWPLQVSKLDDGADLSVGLQLAVARQHGEFEDLTRTLTTLTGPVIIAADFNSTSWSYSLGAFERVSGLTRHTRSLLTYPARFYIGGWQDTPAFLPLDHVMSRGGVEVHEIYAGDPAGSDHKSVVTVFSVDAQLR